MAADEVLRARVEPEFARRVEKWAKTHGKSASEAVRMGLERLLADEEKAKRIEAALREMDRFAAAGVFEPPKKRVRMGGFK